MKIAGNVFTVEITSQKSIISQPDDNCDGLQVFQDQSDKELNRQFSTFPRITRSPRPPFSQTLTFQNTPTCAAAHDGFQSGYTPRTSLQNGWMGLQKKYRSRLTRNQYILHNCFWCWFYLDIVLERARNAHPLIRASMLCKLVTKNRFDHFLASADGEAGMWKFELA